jgi:regulator of CtrA degradation
VMSHESVSPATEPAVAFGARLAASPAFKELFRDGMALAYATESMRLTTRLMQLASWLLLQRAVNEGELTQEQAAQEKSKVRLSSVGASTPQATIDELPGSLAGLIAKAMRLQERIVHMDRLLFGMDRPETPTAANAISGQIDRLAAAFGAKR